MRPSNYPPRDPIATSWQRIRAIVASDEEAAFRQRFEQNKHRFREQVIVTMRGAETADFTDPGLGLIKRLILEKSNAVLGKPLLRSVVFSEFTFIEQ